MTSTSKIPTAVTELAADLVKKIHIVDGKLTVDADVYVTTLPEDVSVEMARKIHDHNQIFYPAATLAFGEKATTLLKKNPDEKMTSLEFPLIDKDHFNVTMHREKSFTVPGTDKKTTTAGYVEATLTTQSSRANRGVMNHVRDTLTEQAMKAFS